MPNKNDAILHLKILNHIQSLSSKEERENSSLMFLMTFIHFCLVRSRKIVLTSISVDWDIIIHKILLFLFQLKQFYTKQIFSDNLNEPILFPLLSKLRSLLFFKFEAIVSILPVPEALQSIFPELRYLQAQYLHLLGKYIIHSL